jgi:hypothetical protein
MCVCRARRGNLSQPSAHNELFYPVSSFVQETALSAEFTFTNPNEKGRCGCGESFST